LYAPFIIYGDLSVEGWCWQGEYGSNRREEGRWGEAWSGQTCVHQALASDMETPVTWQKHFRGENEQL
jgi:hypothetical protein